ncbi:uncharacterized protein LOC109709487 [Ananas comosus]|uniref:Uncharacterized protein LOC109709487 n=1 Tax=Ananas comosus TaxID=4615 RepID=A0A6P5F1G3_ANACO|nr:uncharacterized protein LOC109709487 [Ananas comosus]
MKIYNVTNYDRVEDRLRITVKCPMGGEWELVNISNDNTLSGDMSIFPFHGCIKLFVEKDVLTTNHRPNTVYQMEMRRSRNDQRNYVNREQVRTSREFGVPSLPVSAALPYAMMDPSPLVDQNEW